MSRRKEPAEASDPRRFADLLFEVVNQISLRRFQGRPETEEHRRDEAEKKCDRENRKVRPQLDDDRKIHRREQPSKLLEQEIVAPRAEDQSDNPTTKREQ